MAPQQSVLLQEELTGSTSGRGALPAPRLQRQQGPAVRGRSSAQLERDVFE